MAYIAGEGTAQGNDMTLVVVGVKQEAGI